MQVSVTLNLRRPPAGIYLTFPRFDARARYSLAACLGQGKLFFLEKRYVHLQPPFFLPLFSGSTSPCELFAPFFLFPSCTVSYVVQDIIRNVYACDAIFHERVLVGTSFHQTWKQDDEIQRERDASVSRKRRPFFNLGRFLNVQTRGDT